MPRRVEDIVPSDRRTIKEVPAKEEKKPAAKKIEKEEPVEEIPIHRVHKPLAKMPLTPRESPKKKTKKKGKWLLLALGIVVVIGGIGFIASSTYSRATFTIVPKTMPITANATYVAQYGSADGTFGYELVTVKGSASTTVPASDGTQVSTKSSGKVTVFNAYSETPVRLIAGTRISPDSKRIYRLTGSIVIPGYTKSGSTIVPGKINTDVTADAPGAEYNISRADNSSDFKIVAYAGTDRYEKVYARAVGEILGGYLGTKKIVNQNAVASSSKAMESSMTASLLAKARSSVPEGYVMYQNGYVAKFSSPQVGGNEKNSAVVSVDGTLYGIMIKKEDLADKISQGKAKSTFGKYGFDAKGLDEASFTIANSKDFSPEKKGNLVMHIKGDITLVGKVPVGEIKTKLEGQPLSSIESIFKSYNSVIESGEGELVPPWAKIPTNPDRISINVKEK